MAMTIQEAARRADGELRDDDMEIPTPNVVMIILAQHGGRISFRRPTRVVEGFTSDAPSRFGIGDRYRGMLDKSIAELAENHKIFCRSYPISESGPVQATHGKVDPSYERVIVELA